MPPRKQPKTLQELSLKTVARLTSELCVNIERKHGDWKCQASRDELEIGKTYLSSIRPLFDDLLEHAYYETFIAFTPGFDLKYILLELLVCDKLRTLDFSRKDVIKCTGFYKDSIFWNNQFLKLKNVVELDIRKVQLTNKSFQAIGDVCTKVRKLYATCNFKCVSIKSLKHILKCQELRELRIDFDNWGGNRRFSQCVGMLVVGLPNLEYFHYLFFYWNMNEVKALTKPLTSMRKFEYLQSADLTEMIRMCPNLTDIKLSLNYSRVGAWTVEQDKVLEVLTESSLQLKTLIINKLASIKELARMISCKGSHLTSLDINIYGGKELYVNDVYTIGLSCPKLVELRISKTPDEDDIQSTEPNMEEQTFVTPPRMFVHLKVLHLDSIVNWDQRIAPLIFRHAVNLTRIVLVNVFKPSNTSVDLLSQILNVNELQELESLRIKTWWLGGEFTITSIKRLLDCCPKLVKLYLRSDMDHEMFHYLRKLQNDLESKNVDLELDFNPDGLSDYDSDQYFDW